MHILFFRGLFLIDEAFEGNAACRSGQVVGKLKTHLFGIGRRYPAWLALSLKMRGYLIWKYPPIFNFLLSTRQENLFDCTCPCSCEAVVTKYKKRLSDPLPDRADIHIKVPRVDSSSFTHRVEASEFDAGGDIVLCMTQLNISARAYSR